ncbi:hypothetical protein CBW65_03070 [Tumebacillus avium]|uniref:Peptidase C14 caspase domain-containing protein n=1 Tax=Tumebacillus avium TaxID=1903704 RepID=A0A1Y0IIL6_9BACL|nr:caspase family protein [Tumebacillus avium]ARU60150.1 hypothetical protein CBW65_03070 [Tumebacillus avium]
MNIAILIGVSDYIDPKNNLPGCLNDTNVIRQLLESTGRFQKVLSINKDTNSKQVKGQLADFIKGLEGGEEEVEEVFFYYTGHGQFYENEFYFLLSDFNPERRKTTALENTELDNLLRTLSPKLTIKVVDACQSGVTYVKDYNDEELRKTVSESKKVFSNCYFMFSSQSNQSSFAKSLSYFTESFISAIINHDDESDIRYKDIMDYLADDFNKTPEQTPLFVMQAKNTETFCRVSNDLKVKMKKMLDQYLEIEESSMNHSLTLKDRIQQDALRYCKSKEEVVEKFEIIKEEVLAFQLSEDVNELYNVEVKFYNELESLPKLDIIANSLSKRNRDYFVEFVEEEKEVEIQVDEPIVYPKWDPISDFRRSVNSFFNPSGNRTVKKKVRKAFVEAFDITLDVPFKVIQIFASPKSDYPNIKPFNCEITFAFSKAELKVLYYYGRYKNLDFDNFELIEKEVIWKSQEAPLKDETRIRSLIQTVLVHFESLIRNSLIEQFSEDKSPASEKDQ